MDSTLSSMNKVRGFTPTCREPQGRAIGMLKYWGVGLRLGEDEVKKSGMDLSSAI
jgi:hypothetical protein